MSKTVLLLVALFLVSVVSLFVVPQVIIGQEEEPSTPLFDIIIEPASEEGEIPAEIGMFVFIGFSLIILMTVSIILYGKLKEKDNPQQ